MHEDIQDKVTALCRKARYKATPLYGHSIRVWKPGSTPFNPFRDTWVRVEFPIDCVRVSRNAARGRVAEFVPSADGSYSLPCIMEAIRYRLSKVEVVV